LNGTIYLKLKELPRTYSLDSTSIESINILYEHVSPVLNFIYGNEKSKTLCGIFQNAIKTIEKYPNRTKTFNSADIEIVWKPKK